jgi:phosphoglucosamine mutase
MTVYPQRLVNVRVTDKKDAQADPEVQKKVAEVASLLGDEGRILVRESGTEPLVRVMVEAKTDELCVQYTDAVVETLQNRGFVL